MTHTVWYASLNLIEHVFYSITDLLYLVFAVLVVGIASRPGLRHHLRWANPVAAASLLALIARTTGDLHYFFGIGTRETSYVAGFFFYMLAAVPSVYSTVIFWRVFRDLADRMDHTDPLAPEPQPGVWPPAPVIK